MLYASLDALELNDVPFPDGFTPAYLAKDSSNVWYVFQNKPLLVDFEWTAEGDWYEIGLDSTDTEEETASICRNIHFSDSVFKITSLIENVEEVFV